MKILQVLTYYRPHVSGLTIYVERLCRALVRQGHEVTVLTSQYENDLPREEMMDGVRIVRVPVAFRVSKGVIMPTFGHHATKLALWADIMHLHLPQFDAPGLALRGRLMRRPVVLTYHCDLQLPQGGFNKIVNRVVLTMNDIAGGLANAVVTYTRDYGMHSFFLSRYLGRKLQIIPPPVELAPCSDEEAAARVFNLARTDVAGYQEYARLIRRMFRGDSGVLCDLMEGLFHIAVSDGGYHPAEDAFLSDVAGIFGLGDPAFRALRSRFVPDAHPDPWTVLGVAPGTDRDEVRRVWRQLVREYHPDRMIARGVPAEAIKLAEKKLRDINRAWEEIAAVRVH